jgi:hypothetical protein
VLKELSSAKNVAFFLWSKKSPMKKIALDIGKNDTKLCAQFFTIFQIRHVAIFCVQGTK